MSVRTFSRSDVIVSTKSGQHPLSTDSEEDPPPKPPSGDDIFTRKSASFRHFNTYKPSDVRKRSESEHSRSSSMSKIELTGAAPDYVDASKLPRWNTTEVPDYHLSDEDMKVDSPFPVRNDINSKIALWCGDLALLNTTAITNTTNEVLAEKGALTIHIFELAGPKLRQDVKQNLKVCRTGDAKMSNGYNLAARFVIHCVGPRYNIKFKTAAESALYSCYRKVMQLALEHAMPSIGLCPINSPRRGYPPVEGSHIGLRTVRRFLEKHGNTLDLVVFAVDPDNLTVYQQVLPQYFPRTLEEEKYVIHLLPADIGNEDGEPIIKERQIRISDKPHFPIASMSGNGFDDSVNLAEAFDSSVNIGHHAFSQMVVDPDTRKQKIRRDTITEAFLIEQEKRYERLKHRAQKEDLSSIDALRCLFRSGSDRFGRPVMVFVGLHFPANTVNLDKAMLYLIKNMDSIVKKEYIVVYFHTLTNPSNHLHRDFLKKAYDLFDERYRSNLRAFYVVHPSFWSRVTQWWFLTFSASSIKNKVINITGIEYLYSVIPPDQLDIPEFILDYDIQTNGVRYCNPSTASKGSPIESATDL